MELTSHQSILELGRLKNNTMKHEIFDMLLVLENYPELLNQSEVDQHNTALKCQWTHENDKVNYPLAVVSRLVGKELQFTMLYAEELFECSTVDRMLDTMRTLFLHVVDISKPVSKLDLVSSSTKGLYYAWNSTEAHFANDLTLHATFETAASQWPNKFAVIYKDTKLLYSEVCTISSCFSLFFF